MKYPAKIKITLPEPIEVLDPEEESGKKIKHELIPLRFPTVSDHTDMYEANENSGRQNAWLLARLSDLPTAAFSGEAPACLVTLINQKYQDHFGNDAALQGELLAQDYQPVKHGIPKALYYTLAIPMQVGGIRVEKVKVPRPPMKAYEEIDEKNYMVGEFPGFFGKFLQYKSKNGWARLNGTHIRNMFVNDAWALWKILDFFTPTQEVCQVETEFS